MTTKPKGVMIVGMDMPKSCRECPFLIYRDTNSLYCFLLRHFKDFNELHYNWKKNNIEKHQYCPLQEVK